MLRKTLTTTAFSCLALAANAASVQDNPHPTRQNLVGGKNSSVEALDIPLITENERGFRMHIKVGNDNGKTYVEVLDIKNGTVDIYCTNIGLDYRVLALDNRTEHATADFTGELDKDCNKAMPSGQVHIACDFDGQRRLDLTANYKEASQGRTTTGQQRISQASATCSVEVGGAAFPDLEGELTQSRTD